MAERYTCEEKYRLLYLRHHNPHVLWKDLATAYNCGLPENRHRTAEALKKHHSELKKQIRENVPQQSEAAPNETECEQNQQHGDSLTIIHSIQLANFYLFRFSYRLMANDLNSGLSKLLAITQ